MKADSPYKEAHLVVAAIRILEYQKESPPALGDVADLLSVSSEEAGRLCRKLSAMGIVETVDKAGETRLFVGDHRKIEQIEDRPKESPLSQELEKFRRQKQSERRTLDEIRTSQEQKRKKVQEEIERRLRERMSKKENGT